MNVHNSSAHRNGCAPEKQDYCRYCRGDHPAVAHHDVEQAVCILQRYVARKMRAQALLWTAVVRKLLGSDACDA